MDRGHRSVHVRRLAGTSVIVAFLSAVFVPAVAAQSPPSNSNAFSSKSLEKAVANNSVAAKVTAASRRENEAPKTPKQAGRSGSFFKTPEGVAVLIVMAAGTGYALRSLSKDRIRGAVR
jgi:hypothetical protein